MNFVFKKIICTYFSCCKMNVRMWKKIKIQKKLVYKGTTWDLKKEVFESPSRGIDKPWVYSSHALDSETRKESGKWMFFLYKVNLDIVWKKSLFLFENNYLGNVTSMKISTVKESTNSFNNSLGVMIYYCNNSFDTIPILKTGILIKENTSITANLLYKLDSDVGKYSVHGEKDYCLYTISKTYNFFNNTGKLKTKTRLIIKYT